MLTKLQARSRRVSLVVIIGLHVLAAGLVMIGHLWSGAALGMVIFAYTRGLLHAMDADHLAMIDGSTRKLLGEDRNPNGVGLAFSLGHSTVVMAAGIAVVVGAAWVRDAIDGETALATILGTIGASVSALYLLAVACANLPLLIAAIRGSGETAHTHAPRGWAARALAAPLSRVRHAGHVYLFGLLFGLGFDTATEIGLLVLAGGAAAFNLPVYAILVLPVLFAAGMCLMDTTDGILMNGAYGWAFLKPVRKVFYNLTITAISVAVALIIGTIELVGVVAEQAHIESGPLAAIAAIPLDYAGYAIVLLFVYEALRRKR